MSPKLIVLLTYSGSGLLMAVISIPMIQRLVPPNPFYGFRVRKAFSSPEIWYEINAYSGKRLLVVGLVSALLAALLYMVPGLGLDIYALTLAVVVAIGLIVVLVQSFGYLRQL